MENFVKLPSEFQIKDSVHLAFWSGAKGAWISGVQFIESEDGFKVFYDVKVFATDGTTVKLHRIEEKLIKRYYKNGEYSN